MSYPRTVSAIHDIFNLNGAFMNSKSLLPIFAAFVSTYSYSQDIVIRIGYAGPTSGPIAHLGKDAANGVQLALDELNQRGVLIGGKKAKVEGIFEDDVADPKQGTSVAQAFCDRKVNGIVGHLNSGTTLPAARIYNDCGIPHITPAATNPKITQQGYSTTFRVLANDNSLGAAMAAHSADKLKLRRIVVIDDRTAYGQGVAEIFKKTAKTRGIEVVSEQYTSDKATDFAAILTAIKAVNPDGIFFGGVDAQAGPMLRQMEQLGMTTQKFLGGDGICTTKLAELSSGAKTLSNVACAEGGASIEKMSGGIAWKTKYNARFPGDLQPFSPYAYDATMILVDAMQRAKSIDPKVYLSQLQKTNYQGVTNRITFTSVGELGDPLVTVFEYKNALKSPVN
jgi:branched-chain amino acid transport system substrate-binding protein